MYTGIIDHQGCIQEVQKREAGLCVAIQSKFSDFVRGESISVDGVCVTVTDFSEHAFFCDLSKETLDKTKAALYRQGDKVNLERSLRMGDRMGGHNVLGHVDTTAVISDIERVGDCKKIRIGRVGSSYMSYLIDKGSICVDGISLTLNALTPDGFELMIIPKTLSITTLNSKNAGDVVNLEFDYMVKTIVSVVKKQMEVML